MYYRIRKKNILRVEIFGRFKFGICEAMILWKDIINLWGMLRFWKLVIKCFLYNSRVYKSSVVFYIRE